MSFGWLTTFRQGAWREFRRFVLEERRDISARLDVIDAELLRIGEVRIFYKAEVDDLGNRTGTGKRTGMYVTPGSSLEKLMRAYVAQGGNPLDISMFMYPDQNLSSGTQTIRMYPKGGVLYPKGADPRMGGLDESGYIPLKKYPIARMGGDSANTEASEDISSSISNLRGWVSQEIAHKRNNLEAKILKLCDLAEQLRQERDEKLQQAVAGTMSSFPTLDRERFVEALRVPNLVDEIDRIFYLETEEGTPDPDSVNTESLSEHPTLLADDLSGEEEGTAL